MMEECSHIKTEIYFDEVSPILFKEKSLGIKESVTEYSVFLDFPNGSEYLRQENSHTMDFSHHLCETSKYNSNLSTLTYDESKPRSDLEIIPYKQNNSQWTPVLKPKLYLMNENRSIKNSNNSSVLTVFEIFSKIMNSKILETFLKEVGLTGTNQLNFICTLSDLKKYIAISFWMSLLKLHHPSLYWSSEKIAANFSKIMPYKKWKTIHRVLFLKKNDQDPFKTLRQMISDMRVTFSNFNLKTKDFAFSSILRHKDSLFKINILCDCETYYCRDFTIESINGYPLYRELKVPQKYYIASDVIRKKKVGGLEDISLKGMKKCVTVQEKKVAISLNGRSKIALREMKKLTQRLEEEEKIEVKNTPLQGKDSNQNPEGDSNSILGPRTSDQSSLPLSEPRKIKKMSENSNNNNLPVWKQIKKKDELQEPEIQNQIENEKLYKFVLSSLPNDNSVKNIYAREVFFSEEICSYLKEKHPPILSCGEINKPNHQLPKDYDLFLNKKSKLNLYRSSPRVSKYILSSIENHDRVKRIKGARTGRVSLLNYDYQYNSACIDFVKDAMERFEFPFKKINPRKDLFHNLMRIAAINTFIEFNIKSKDEEQITLVQCVEQIILGLLKQHCIILSEYFCEKLIYVQCAIYQYNKMKKEDFQRSNIKTKLVKYSQQNKHLFCYVLAILSNIFFTLESYWVKKVKDVSKFQIVYVRSMFLLIPNYLIAVYSDNREILPKSPYANRLLIFRGIISLVAMFFYFFGLATLPLSEAMVLFFTNPVITTVLASIFLKEKLEILDILACFSCLVGIVLVIRPPFIFSSESKNEHLQMESPLLILGAISILIAAFARSIATIVIRNVVKSIPTLAITLHYGMMAGLLSPLVIVWYGEVSSLSIESVLKLMILGIFGWLGQFFMSAALGFGKAATVSILGYMQIVFAFLLDIFFNDQIPTFTSILGGILISVTLFTNLYKMFNKSSVNKS